MGSKLKASRASSFGGRVKESAGKREAERRYSNSGLSVIALDRPETYCVGAKSEPSPSYPAGTGTSRWAPAPLRLRARDSDGHRL